MEGPVKRHFTLGQSKLNFLSYRTFILTMIRTRKRKCRKQICAYNAPTASCTPNHFALASYKDFKAKVNIAKSSFVVANFHSIVVCYRSASTVVTERVVAAKSRLSS